MIDHIGIIGGGQLGRMLTQAALPLGFRVTVVDPSPECPAAQVGARQIRASLDDFDAIEALAKATDVVTWEIEHIPVKPLMHLVESGYDIQPSPLTLEIIQDKLHQKQFLAKNGIPTAPFGPYLESAEGPLIVKSRRGGYDGRGNLFLQEPDHQAVQQYFGDAEIYVEQAVPFDTELAVIATRDRSGTVSVFPVIETVQQNNICTMAFMPPDVSPRVSRDAVDLAHDLLKLLDGAGVFAIEMFAAGESVLINEIAPRVHNSGHLTIEGCTTSQFEQHIRAVAGLPLGSPAPRAPAALMINILGTRQESLHRDGLERVLELPDTHAHFYGKTPAPNRKIGHITVLGTDLRVIRDTAQRARDALSI